MYVRTGGLNQVAVGTICSGFILSDFYHIGNVWLIPKCEIACRKSEEGGDAIGIGLQSFDLFISEKSWG